MTHNARKRLYRQLDFKYLVLSSLIPNFFFVKTNDGYGIVVSDDVRQESHVLLQFSFTPASCADFEGMIDDPTTEDLIVRYEWEVASEQILTVLNDLDFKASVEMVNLINNLGYDRHHGLEHQFLYHKLGLIVESRTLR